MPDYYPTRADLFWLARGESTVPPQTVHHEHTVNHRVVR